MHDKLWRAGVIQLSLANYEDKKRILSFDDKCCTGGVEYYAEGIFEIAENEKKGIIVRHSEKKFKTDLTSIG